MTRIASFQMTAHIKTITANSILKFNVGCSKDTTIKCDAQKTY